MKNYISINGQKTELTEEQIEQIKASFGLESVRLSSVSVGDTVKIGDYELIVLEQSGDTTALICKNFIETCIFGDSNNYDGSNVDKLCNKFATNLAKVVGEDNVIQHTVDLTADDGLKDYGTVKRLASLLTTDLYRRYVYTLDKFKPDAWWWLATAYSTPTHDHTSWVKCVSPSGRINYDDYYYFFIGVRPFCILNSNIFVSK
ncbi:MAG: hypothetical protein J6Q30_00805 [Oscillospiraceae bacterium]|nr:hypothetical protein [Oscillospiraceae bacterium]